MKKLLVLFLIIDSATILYTMERDDQPLNWFRNEGWKIVNISQERPKSGNCIKAYFTQLAQTENIDRSTKKEYPVLLHMDLYYPDQTNQVAFVDIIRCKFLSWETPFLPQPTCYVTVQNELNETRILEINKVKNLISTDDSPEPEVKHNTDKDSIADIMKSQLQVRTIQPKIEVPSAVAKPQSATTKFVGSFWMTLTLPLAALFAAYRMGYLSQFLDGISAKFFAIGR